jgi:hypothetical protein
MIEAYPPITPKIRAVHLLPVAFDLLGIALPSDSKPQPVREICVGGLRQSGRANL